MKRAMILGILASAFYSGALAQDAGTAEDFYGQCFRNESICGSYLMGVATGLLVIGESYQSRRREHRDVGPLRAYAICADGEPIESSTLLGIFGTWLEEHPARKQRPMRNAAVEFFRAKWPCDKKESN